MRDAPEKKDCFEAVRIYDFYKIMDYINGKNLWHEERDLHDDMFEMISHSDQEGKNDSVHRVYRSWFDSYNSGKVPHLFELFDLICEIFHIDKDISKYDGEDQTMIYMWVSW